MGKSAYEVLAGLSTPWTKTLPILNDALVLQALQQGKRPSLNYLENLYEKKIPDEIYSLLQTAWTGDHKRIQTNEVTQIYYYNKIIIAASPSSLLILCLKKFK